MTAKALAWTTAHLLTVSSAEEVKTAIAEAKAALGDEAVPTAKVLELLEELASESAKLRAEVRSANRAREVLLASVAHDLRNPLNTFAMSTGLLRDDLESPEFERNRAISLVTRMDRASIRMQRLIEDLLEASRIEAGNIELTKKPEDAGEVVRGAIEKANSLASDKGAKIEAAIIEEGLTVTLDKTRAIEALTKLISIGLKSTGEGGVIKLGVERRDDKVAFSVRGLAPRATKSTAPDESRGGLALLIARGLIAAHGGSLLTETLSDGSRMLAVF
jgi:signal transduction histidine kinase